MFALITGASTGIGFEFANQLCHEYNLILISQNSKRLNQASKKIKKKSKKKVYPLVCNLKNLNSLSKIKKFLNQKKIKIDFLINNAGFGYFGPFTQMSETEINDMLDLNIKTLTQLTRLILPSMLAQKSGKIINVASTAAFQPLPYMGVYAASKNYVLYYTEALAREVETNHIRVLALCPGATHTPFFDRATQKTPLNKKSGFFQLKKFMTSTAVVDLALKAIKKNQNVVITGGTNRFITFLPRLFPRSWISAISKRLLEKSLKLK